MPESSQGAGGCRERVGRGRSKAECEVTLLGGHTCATHTHTNTHRQGPGASVSAPTQRPQGHQGKTRRPRDISVLPVMKRLPAGAGPRSLDCAEKRWGRGEFTGTKTSGDPMIKEDRQVRGKMQSQGETDARRQQCP